MDKEKIKELKKKVTQDGLYINRVPKKVRKEFIDWAKADFEGDYGMTLKWLMDFRTGLLSSPNQLLAEQIEVLANEIEQLKSVPKEEPEPKKERITSISGRVIRTGGK